MRCVMDVWRIERDREGERAQYSGFSKRAVSARGGGAGASYSDACNAITTPPKCFGVRARKR